MQGHGGYRLSPVSGKKKSVCKLQIAEREKLLKSLTCTGNVILKHPCKSITNFPEANVDMSGQLKRQAVGLSSLHTTVYIVHATQNAPVSQ